MPEENEDQLAEEMLRMMQEETGEADSAETAEEDADGTDMAAAMAADADESSDDNALESQMFQAMMEESDESALPAPAAQTMAAMMPAGQDVPANITRMMNVSLSVSIELGRTEVPIEIVLEWTEGSLIELSKVSGDAVDVLVNGKLFAKGEVVTIAENFGVRITELLPVVKTQP